MAETPNVTRENLSADSPKDSFIMNADFESPEFKELLNFYYREEWYTMGKAISTTSAIMYLDWLTSSEKEKFIAWLDSWSLSDQEIVLSIETKETTKEEKETILILREIWLSISQILQTSLNSTEITNIVNSYKKDKQELLMKIKSLSSMD